MRAKRQSAFPPQDEQYRDRQKDDGSLGQHRQQKKPRANRVRLPIRVEVPGPAIGTRIVKPREFQIKQHGTKAQNPAENIFAFADPADGFRLKRMDRPDCRRRPRAGDFQPPKDSPQQHRRPRVKQQVYHPISKSVILPDMMLDPERRERQRVVLNSPRRDFPDFLQPRGIEQRMVVGDVLVIIPQKRAVDRRPKRHQRDQRQHRRPEIPVSPRSRIVRHGDHKRLDFLISAPG